jgi:hypothetical protein
MIWNGFGYLLSELLEIALHALLGAGIRVKSILVCSGFLEIRTRTG